MTGKLEIKLLNYFLLIAFAAMMIGIEFYFELSRAGLAHEICSVTEQQELSMAVKDGAAGPSFPLAELRNKIVIMFGVLTIVVAIVLMMFIKNITMPLQKMADVAQRINQGDLSQIVPIETKDEISQVGAAINELTSNLQEVATFTAATTTEALRKLNILSIHISTESPYKNEIKDVKQSLETLIEFVNSFELLQTDISK